MWLKLWKSLHYRWILVLLITAILLYFWPKCIDLSFTVNIYNYWRLLGNNENMTTTFDNKYIYAKNKPLIVEAHNIHGVKESLISNSFLVTQTLKQYLVPITNRLHNETVFNNSLSEHILRNGIGLEPYTTEKNEEIWIENGVQYRPYPFLETADNPYYTSEFEAYVPFNKSTFFEGDEKKSSVDIRDKKIILWWQHKRGHAPINGLNPLRACPEFPCVLTSDRKYTENSSAMLVNAQFVNNEKPPKRRPDQFLIHYQTEPPYQYWYYGDLFVKDKDWNSAFNWTMSYRMDADIITNYGLTRKRLVPKTKNYANVLAEKTGSVFWMVYDCHSSSKREEYIRELQLHIDVDIYGTCGPFRCPRSNQRDCLSFLIKKYKFFLAFESALCKDYVSEKLFRYLDKEVIVITRGYNTYSRLLPSEIFLNTANFKSPKELADKLLYLNSHDQEYIDMLREKDKYFSLFEDYPLTAFPPVLLEYRYEAVSMCSLCQRIWNGENYSKSITNMSKWFLKSEYQCNDPDDLMERYF